MNCPNCGYENRNNAIFCDNCGSEFKQQNAVQTSAQNTETAQKPKKSKAKIIIALVAVLMVISMIAVAAAAVIVVSLNTYVCSDCEEKVYFKEYVIWDEDHSGGVFVCEDCYDKWQSEEFGASFSGELY